MRTIYPLVVVLALIVSSMMISMSGFGAIVGQEDQAEIEGDERLKDNASNAPQKDGVSGSVLGLDNPLVSLIVDGIDGFISIVSFVALLPLNLRRLGAPAWFAFPLGIISQLIIGVGVFQLLANRRLT